MFAPSSTMAAVDDPESPPPLSADHGLFLDFDGTLVDLADRPDGVVVDAGLIALLAALRTRLSGRIAIVSGRSLRQLDDLLGEGAAGIALVGSHGAERRTATEGVVRPEAHGAIAAAARAFADFATDHDGVVVETKSLGAALHYRLAPQHADEANRLAARLATEHGLYLQEGKMMAEVRMAGDKGAGVRALMALPDFAGSTPLFLGDDVTDEDGFVAAREGGGGGVLVGAPRATAARWRLGGVAAVRAWLAAGVEALA